MKSLLICRFTFFLKKSSIFKITGVLILLLIAPATFAQQQTGAIKGTVKTSDKKPAEGVTISIKEIGRATSVNEEGNFSLNHIKPGTYTLSATFIGFKPETQQVVVEENKTTEVHITLAESSQQLSEVVVRSRKANRFAIHKSNDVAKMPLDNLENPQSYSTISNELITEQNITTVDDALKNAPGVQLMWEATGRGGDGGGYYNMRGFITQSMLRNGIAGNVTNSIDAVNVESIEVVKGPSATLFGNAFSSYGGLINRVTKTPYNDFGGDVTVTAGGFGYERTALDLNTPLDSAKKVLFRLNTALTDKGSYTNNGFNHNLAVDPSLVYKVNDRLSISFDAEINTAKGTLLPIYFFPYNLNVASLGASFANQLPLQYRQSYNNGDLAQTFISENFYGQVDYKISDHWKSQTNFASVYSYSNGFGPYYYLASRDSIDRDDQSTLKSSEKTLEVQENINGDFHIGKLRNRFVGGLDFTRIASHQLYLEGTLDKVPDQGGNYLGFNSAVMSNIYANPKDYYTFPYIFNNNTYAAYASDVLNITDRLLASAGLRLNYFDNQGSYDPASGITSGAYHQTALSPKFGLVYQLVKDQLSLFGNYQNGFTDENGTDVNHHSFKPEQANQLEGGLKYDLFNGKLSGTVSYYDIKVKDIIRTDPDNANFSIQNGTQVSRGIEAEVIANPFAGFNVIGGFAYNYSVYTNADPTVNGRRPGTAASPYSANLWASYRIQNGVLKGLGAGAGGNYASNNMVLNSTTQGVFSLPEYYVFNASAFYEWKQLRLSAGVNNFTNREWFTGYSTINPQMPRQFIGSISCKF
jgi:iron complex outermembrane receptor protein